LFRTFVTLLVWPHLRAICDDTKPKGPKPSRVTEAENASPSGSQRALISPLLVVCSSSAAAAVMEPLEVAITIIFDALLLVFMVKLFFAMFQMKLVVILFYLVILLFAMAFSGRAPSSF